MEEMDETMRSGLDGSYSSPYSSCKSATKSRDISSKNKKASRFG
jgi:hypothetical protein